MTAQGKRNYHTLDGLRGLAALAVVTFHCAEFTGVQLFYSSYLAVDLFFLMSGFVIAHAYDPRLSSGMSARAFMLARLIRLYPLYALGTAISVLGIAAGLLVHAKLLWTWQSLAEIGFPAAFMLPGPPALGKRDWLYTLNVPAWSLLFELLINFVFAIGFVALRGRALWGIIGVAALSVVGLAVLGVSFVGGSKWSDAWVGVIRVSFSFFFGVAMYRLHLQGRLPQPKIPPPLVLLMAVAAFAVHTEGSTRQLTDAISILVLFPILLCASVAKEPSAGLAAYSFSGLVSYPLYVVHLPVIYVTQSALAQLPGGMVGRTPLFAVVMIPALLVLCWALATYYDIPTRKALARLTRPRATPTLP